MYPNFNKYSDTCDPINPQHPVTKIFFISLLFKIISLHIPFSLQYCAASNAEMPLSTVMITSAFNFFTIWIKTPVFYLSTLTFLFLFMARKLRIFL